MERHSRLYYVHITESFTGKSGRLVRPPFSDHPANENYALRFRGICLALPSISLPLLDNRIEYDGGDGLSVLMLNGETRDADLSAFSPLRLARGLPYNAFCILDSNGFSVVRHVEPTGGLDGRWLDDPYIRPPCAGRPVRGCREHLSDGLLHGPRRGFISEFRTLQGKFDLLFFLIF